MGFHSISIVSMVVISYQITDVTCDPAYASFVPAASAAVSVAYETMPLAAPATVPAIPAAVPTIPATVPAVPATAPAIPAAVSTTSVALPSPATCGPAPAPIIPNLITLLNSLNGATLTSLLEALPLLPANSILTVAEIQALLPVLLTRLGIPGGAPLASELNALLPTLLPKLGISGGTLTLEQLRTLLPQLLAALSGTSALANAAPLNVSILRKLLPLLLTNTLNGPTRTALVSSLLTGNLLPLLGIIGTNELQALLPLLLGFGGVNSRVGNVDELAQLLPVLLIMGQPGNTGAFLESLIPGLYLPEFKRPVNNVKPVSGNLAGTGFESLIPALLLSDLIENDQAESNSRRGLFGRRRPLFDFLRRRS